jgi:putative peptidoglycan lipid II flippase
LQPLSDLLNVVMLVAVLQDPTRAAYAASIGVIVAGIGQAALCWWGAHMTGARIHPKHLRLTPPIRALIRRMVPGVIASSATQINLFISAMLASQVAGMRVWRTSPNGSTSCRSAVGVAIGVPCCRGSQWPCSRRIMTTPPAPWTRRSSSAWRCRFQPPSP